MSLSRSEQARLNGAKSHGPKTDAGKARSAMNASQHGLSGQRLVVLNNENDAAFQQLFQAFLDKFQPEDDVEREFVLQAAAARWRLRRIWQLETALFDAQMDAQAAGLKRDFVTIDEGTRQAKAFAALADNSNSLSLLNRYERTISREYDRAIRALDRARAEREHRAEAGQQPQPEPEIEKIRNEPKPPVNAIAASERPQPGTPPAAAPVDHDPPVPRAA